MMLDFMMRISMVASHHVQTKYRVMIVPSHQLWRTANMFANQVWCMLKCYWWWVELMGGKSQKAKKKKKKETLGKSAKMTGRRTRVCLICSGPVGASSQPASTRGRSQPIGIILRRVQEARKQEKKRKIGTFLHYYRSAETKNLYTLMLF